MHKLLSVIFVGQSQLCTSKFKPAQESLEAKFLFGTVIKDLEEAILKLQSVVVTPFHAPEVFKSPPLSVSGLQVLEIILSPPSLPVDKNTNPNECIDVAAKLIMNSVYMG